MSIPANLPHLRIQIEASGAPTFTLDDEDYAPPGGPHSPGRDSVRHVLDAACQDLGAIRVEIIEADGSIYSDILAADDADSVPASTGVAGDAYASGFLPGEPVAVAVIIGEHAASEDGTTTVRLPAAVLARYGGTVMLLGRSSGTLTFLGADR